MIIQILKALLIIFVFTFATFELIAFVYDRFLNKKLIKLRKEGHDLEVGWKFKKLQEENKNG